MKRLRPFSLALVASATLAWTLPAFAVYPGSCANGKTIYNKTNPAAGANFSCSNSLCHKSDPTQNSKYIQRGAGSPGAINFALDGTGANAEMTALDLRNSLPLSDQDIDDLATWIFYAPSCPSGGAPNLQATPAPVSFPSTAVNATSATTTITITNAGSASALAVTASTPDATHFPLSANTCSNVTVAAGGSCSFKVAFRPTTAGALSNNITVNRTGGALTVGVSGTGTSDDSPATVPVVEYYNAALDHFFITPVAAEVSLLDTKSAPFQDWSRTGFSFNSYANATAPASSVAMCRFFNESFAPKSSHFYAPHGFGCEATIASFPDWKLEDDKLFNEMLPDGSGNCPAGTIPVYRLYNQGMGGAPNHRFVTSLAERQKMINKGYVAEGAGIGVGMCAPL